MTEHGASGEAKPRRDPAPVEAAEQELPLGVRVAAAWSWRLITIGLAVAGLLWLIVQVRIIVIPLLVAILLAALLQPIVEWFPRNGAPKWMGVVTALFALVISVTFLVMLIVSQLKKGFGGVPERAQSGWREFIRWLEGTPFGLSGEQVDGFVDTVMQTIENNQSEIWSGALGVATTAGQFVAGSLLAVFSLIFLLFDGRRIWFWVLGFLPARAHAPADMAGRAGWVSVGQYVRVQILVALVDGAGTGLGAAILGVPFPLPIAILVFLGSFIPFLGAITTGAVAVFIALVYNGPLNAVMMLGVVILVNQIEGHVLQPLIMGNAVRVHPLGVVLAVSGGALLAGIPGALFAVPIAASANAIVNVLVRREWDSTRNPVEEFHRREGRLRVARHRAKNIARMSRRKGNS